MNMMNGTAAASKYTPNTVKSESSAMVAHGYLVRQVARFASVAALPGVVPSPSTANVAMRFATRRPGARLLAEMIGRMRNAVSPGRSMRETTAAAVFALEHSDAVGGVAPPPSEHIKLQVGALQSPDKLGPSQSPKPKT